MNHLKQDQNNENDDEQWVQVAETNGTSQTGMVVEYLRERGIHAVALGSRALGMITGENTAARVMVTEEEVGQALDLLEPESDYESWDDTDESDSSSSMSGTTRALLDATAFVFNPLGTGIAYAASQSMDSDGDKSANNLIDCPNCRTGLELSADEIELRQFTCPECDEIVQLDDFVVCPHCQSELELEADERSRGWYICPECRWAVRFGQGVTGF